MVIVLMGVSGCGKTTIGRALAERIGARFVEGDELHSPENRAKMASGTPLTEDDRGPWLRRIRDEIDKSLADGSDAVVACSALTANSRRTLGTERDGVVLVHLDAPQSFIADRLAQRKGHFMPAGLLDSQFAALERPDDAIVVSIDQSVDDTVACIVQSMG